MKLRNFPALAATLFLGTAVLATDDALSPPTTRVTVGPDATDVKLENGLDLSRRNLSNVRINNIYVRGVDFSGSDLTGADLRFARFQRCNFSNATLTNVAINDSTTFEECDFHGAKLQNVKLTPVAVVVNPPEDYDKDGMRIRKIEPSDAELLGNPTFIECDFTDAALRAVPPLDQWTFQNCVFQGVYLADVNARGALSLDADLTANVKRYKEFDGVDLDKTPQDLFGAVLTRTSFATVGGDVDFTDARLTDVTACGLTGRQLAQTANFRQKRYVGLRLADANFEKYDFSSAFLTRCNFSKIDFTDADFTDAVLYDCEFRDVEGLTLEQLKSTWNWKSNSLDLASFDDALQAQIKAALAETQTDEAQDVANAKRAETAAAFGLSPLKSPASSSLHRRYVLSNSTFDAIPRFRVASIERRYRADANGDAFVFQRLNPENAVVIQAPRPPQERFVVELVGDDLRTATLQIEYFPTAKSCRDRLLDLLAEDGEKRWKLDAKKSALDDVCFVATGDALTSRFLFTSNEAIYDLTFNDKTSLEEAEAVRRYIARPSGVAGSLKLNRPDLDPR
jgi:uncharacterized protein YjbI with pentapeptide repeats